MTAVWITAIVGAITGLVSAYLAIDARRENKRRHRETEGDRTAAASRLAAMDERKANQADFELIQAGWRRLHAIQGERIAATDTENLRLANDLTEVHRLLGEMTEHHAKCTAETEAQRGEIADLRHQVELLQGAP